MRRKAFVVFILGMFILMLFFEFTEDGGNVIGSKVEISGKVVSERVFGSERILNLDSGEIISCECSMSFKGKLVFIEGVVEKYGGVRIRALKIEWIG